MKKRIGILLAAILLLGCLPALAWQDVHVEKTADKPQSHITVGSTTRVNGMFFTNQFGNNASDIDVRSMLHGYNPVVWASQVEFSLDPQVVADMHKTISTDGSMTYTITLHKDLKWNDGTPIHAADYVFAYLLQASPEFAAIGADTAVWRHIVGYEEYANGKTDNLQGVRLLDEDRYSITVKAEYEPYFYEFSYLSVNPCPIAVIAPGCTVVDRAAGAAIVDADNNTAQTAFTAQLLESTVMGEEGYMTHPELTCGPYSLVAYDAASGQVEFERNVLYKGNYEGAKPAIDTVTLVPVLQSSMIDDLLSGKVDLLNKVASENTIKQARKTLNNNRFKFQSYARLGYGFVAIACEQGPQQFEKVRQALACVIDSKAFVKNYLGGSGLTVKGYYGIGQWMNQAVNGSYRPENIDEAQQKQWDALSLDVLDAYDYDAERALNLLIEDGWVLNADGDAFDPAKDDIRYKQLEDGSLMPLTFRFAVTKDNAAAAYIVSGLQSVLPVLGAQLVETEISFTDLLKAYYREGGNRSYDLAFMATNFISTFDPYMHFASEADYAGAMNTSGIDDA
ncbi:MAG: ABC transporter substrate-binding protein [Clostridia bacterium]|nr:ABC transporter substrate-binding protein [Clostridia bacterium]